MSAFVKFHCFAQDLGRKVHDLNSDVLKIMLSNVAPAVGALTKADITEIAAGNGYPAGGIQIGNTSFVQTAGVGQLKGDDVLVTASGGNIGPFRYAILYNDSALNDELIGYWDHGVSLTLADGEAVTANFTDAQNVICDLT